MNWLDDAVAKAADAQPVVPVSDIPEVVPGRVLIVDGDYLAYNMAGNDETEPGKARGNLLNRLHNMKVMGGCESITVHLTASGSTKADRYVIAATVPYQNKRSGRRPKNWAYLREFMEGYTGDKFSVKVWGTREADDGMAYHAMILGVDKACIATRDKDLRMVPAHHLDWQTYQLIRLGDEFEVTGVNGLLYGPKWFWTQCLQGDDADDIPGLPRYVPPSGKPQKVGEVTAAKFLKVAKSNAEAFTTVAALYRTYYNERWPDQLAEQMALLWIRRDKFAELDDCLEWVLGDLKDSDVYMCMWHAFNRLSTRVKNAKAEVANIGKA